MRTRLLLLAAGLFALPPATGRAEPVRFNRDVLPILADTCFPCHGPDGARRKAGLRLDREEDARRVRDGHAAVVPGKLDASELVRRITSDDPDERMPPKGSG